MKFWNFVHSLSWFSRPIHVYEFLALVIAAVMLIAACVHYFNFKRREEKFEDELQKISEAPSPEKSGESVRGDAAL